MFQATSYPPRAQSAPAPQQAWDALSFTLPSPSPQPSPSTSSLISQAFQASASTVPTPPGATSVDLDNSLHTPQAPSRESAEGVSSQLAAANMTLSSSPGVTTVLIHKEQDDEDSDS